MNQNLILATTTLLKQLKNCVTQLDDNEFCQPSATLSNVSIGQHVRHTLEFFLCLIDAVPSKKLDYDNRKHDKIIESDRKVALNILDDIVSFIQRNPENFELQFEVNYGIEENINAAVQSNFYRELAYNIEHAVHHMALIKIGIREICPNVKIEDGFGVATSTIRYQQEQANTAS
ncbi:MAG: hypothetical protein RJQ09_12585 [Cyclobacteriaceae bacterium]